MPIELKCIVCNKIYKTKPYMANISKFCSRKCNAIYNIAGKNKNRIKLICQHCNKEYEVPACRTKRGKKFSKYCSVLCGNRAKAFENKIKGTHKDSNNWRWKGGVSVAYYKRIFKEKLPKKCQICNSIKNLDVHHLDENRSNNIISNFQVVCRSCHKKIHNNPRDSFGRFI
jgi:hypothetical protein